MIKPGEANVDEKDRISANRKRYQAGSKNNLLKPASSLRKSNSRVISKI